MNKVQQHEQNVLVRKNTVLSLMRELSITKNKLREAIEDLAQEESELHRMRIRESRRQSLPGYEVSSN